MVSVAVIVAVGVNGDGRREVLGLAIGASEAETFWTDFLRKLARRGLRGVKLVVSDAHEGLKAAIAKVLDTSWQRCLSPLRRSGWRQSLLSNDESRVHFMRNVLAHAGKQGRRVVAAFIGTAFAQDDAEAARTQWRQIADQLRPRVKTLAELMDEAESDVLAYMSFPSAHRPKLHSTNPIERLNGEIKRRTEVVGARHRQDGLHFHGSCGLFPPMDVVADRKQRYRRSSAPPERRQVLRLAIFAAIGLRSLPSGAATSAVAATIEQFYAALVKVMKAGKAVPFRQRFDTLAPMIDRTFDLDGISWARSARTGRR